MFPLLSSSQMRNLLEIWGWRVSFICLVWNVIAFIYDYVYEGCYEKNVDRCFNYLSGYADNSTTRLSHLVFYPKGKVYTFVWMVNSRQHCLIVEVQDHEGTGKGVIYKRLGYLVTWHLSRTPFLYILLYTSLCNVEGWSTTLFHTYMIPSTSIVSYIYLPVIQRSAIRMSVGTFDTTVISSTKTEARNLNAIDASAAQRDDLSPATFPTTKPKNRQFHLLRLRLIVSPLQTLLLHPEMTHLQHLSLLLHPKTVRKVAQSRIYINDYSTRSYLEKQCCIKMNIFYILLSKIINLGWVLCGSYKPTKRNAIQIKLEVGDAVIKD